MVTDLLIIMMIGHQRTVTITTPGIDIIQYNSLFSVVTIQPHPCIIIYDSVCSADGEA